MMTMAATAQENVSPEQTLADDSPDAPWCGLALVGHGEAYNEEAFHHFLSIERKRSEASTRPFLLLLVEFEKSNAGYLDHDLASGVFSALTSSLRDTDVIGWYREDRIAGAVLTDLGDAAHGGVDPGQITERVRGMVGLALRENVARSVQVRIYQLPARLEATAEPMQRRG